MPLEVNEINKIDERFSSNEAIFCFFSVVLTETSPEKSKTIRNLPKNQQFLGLWQNSLHLN